MPYPAHVTDTAYCYDGSFKGFLCCVFESYAKQEIPSAVLPPEQGQMTLFGTKQIETNDTKARRVAVGLDRCGMETMDRITTGFLSDEQEKDLILLRFARLCFDRGPSAVRMLGDPDVAAAFAVERSVTNEAHRYIELLRFEQRGDMLGSVIHPKAKVLPLLRAHFCSRLPDENFLIFDATHGVGMLRQGNTVQYLEMKNYQPEPDDAEMDWQTMWKRFFKALTIEERRNAKVQMGHAPKRLWQDMCEMQADLPRGEGQ